MRRAHLRRYGVPRPPCHVTRETIGPTNFRLRGPDMAPHSPYARTPRVACHRAPPRSWTLLTALAALLRQAPGRPGAYNARTGRAQRVNSVATKEVPMLSREDNELLCRIAP